MINAKYIFKRSNSLKGFFSTNSASTDAISALDSWSVQKDSWNYRIEEHEENSLVAILSLDESESDVAGVKLQDACEEYGIERTYVPG
ncbi:MAG: hypothetical protein GYB21_12300 [Oceanospirillales bacterium]|nr:hypothetical protein [Oceanospirillales bacterium]